MIDPQLKQRLDFVRRAERLKDTVRSGHTSGGRAESVADHTWRLTLLAITFSDLLPEIDQLRLLRMCILHDLGEAVDGDVPAPSQSGAEAKAAKERKDFASLVSVLPTHLQSEFLSLWDEYENAETREARVAKALDKIETLLQHNQGANPEGFDYAFNLEYGKAYTDTVPLAARIRAIIDEETSAHAARTPSGG